MNLSRGWSALTFATVVAACGGTQSNPGAEGPSESSCAGFELEGSDLESCQAVEVDCPGAVRMMETSPPQFACANDDSSAADAPPCEGYTLGDSCVDDAAFAQCQEVAAQCPGEVQVMESCPLQFACP